MARIPGTTLLCSWLLAAAPVLASAGPEAARIGLSLQSAYAWDTVPVFGGARDAPRSVRVLGIHLHRRVLSREHMIVDYTAGVVPLELEGGTVVEDVAGYPRKVTAYGAGLDPVGFFARFGHGWLCPFASVRGGIRLFSKAVPNPRGIPFDFTADIAVGLARRVRGRTWILAGPEFHHVSNGGLADANPSINYLALRVGALLASR